MGEKGNGKRILRLKQRFTNQLGFTLVELMAVLTILAIIIAIAVPAIGSIIEKGKKTADETSIDLMEDAGENAYVDDRIDFDGPEPESYTIPTLIEEGYLKLDEDHKFNQPENYVTKKNDGGEFVWMGDGSLEDGEAADEPYVAMNCEEAEAQGYTCIYTPEDLDGVRNGLSGKYILMNDIDLVSFAEWEPIGTTESPFSGELNGNTFNVQNMVITDYSGLSVGLFGVVSGGVFQQLGLQDFTMTNRVSNLSDVSVGALIGRITADDMTNPANDGVLLDGIDVSMTQNTLDKDSLTRLDSYDWGMGGLVGSAVTNASITVSDVDLDVGYDTRGGFVGGVIGTIAFVDETDETDVLFDGVRVSGHISSNLFSVGGLVYEVEMDNVKSGSFTVRDIEMSADLSGENASGVAYNVGLYYADNGAEMMTTLENINVSGSLTGSSNVSGLVLYMYSKDTVIRGVEISSPMTSNYAYGLGSSLYVGTDDSATVETFLMEDVTVTSDMAYVYSAAGVYEELYPSGTKNDIVIRDILVDSEMASTAQYATATGFISYYQGDPVGNTYMSNVNIHGTLKGYDVNGVFGGVYPSSGTYYDPSVSESEMVLSNITMGAALTGVRSVNGLFDGNSTTDLYSKMALKDIHVSGALQTESGYIYGVAYMFRINLENDDAIFEMDNVDVTSEMLADSGDISPFVEWWLINRASDDASWNYDQVDKSTWPIGELDALVLKNNAIPSPENMQTISGEIYPGLVNQ